MNTMYKFNYSNVLGMFKKLRDMAENREVARITPGDEIRKYCASCGKCLTITIEYTDGSSNVLEFVGSKIGITDETGLPEIIELIQQQLGIYKPKDYYFCYECLLKSLGAKP